MTGAVQREVRRLLLGSADGMTVPDLASVLGKDPSTVYQSINAMPDVYIDRWRCDVSKRPAAVFIAVHVPDDCPPPRRRRARI